MRRGESRGGGENDLNKVVSDKVGGRNERTLEKYYNKTFLVAVRALIREPLFK